MFKTLTILPLCSLLIFAEELQLKQAPENAQRITPTSTQTIYSYNQVLSKTLPSIVHISSSKVSRQDPNMQRFMEDFFGHRFTPPSNKKSMGLGSGVILSEEGYIVTNNHVIDKADEITVTLPGKDKTYEAKLIGTDPKSDIALIKIDTKDKLEPVMLGDSSNLKVGDLVFAIGNPFGVGQSVTQGIISAQHKNGIGINEYENFIQTDASINPGNSGGALVDSRGALIGINTAILSRSGGNNGIGFAIEVNMVKDVVQRLVKDGKIERAYLGVQIGNLDDKLTNLYSHNKGALIIDVSENTPAQKAGLQRGDLIIKVNGKSIKNAADLKNSIGMMAPQSKADITYERDKKLKTITVALDSQSSSHGDDAEVFAGLSLSNLDDKLRYQYRIPQNIEGVFIQGIEANSDAQNAGFQTGDIIIQIENMNIRSINDVKKALKRFDKDYKRIYINRAGRIYMLALK